MSNSKVIMDGKVYYQNRAGALVPESSVKEIDKLKDQTVEKIVERTLELEKKMIEVKEQNLSDLEYFMKISEEDHNVHVGGLQGNVQLVSYDGTKRVVRTFNKSFEFNEGIAIAKELIDEFLADKTAKSDDRDIVTLINNAFAVRQGKLDVKRMLELRNYKIEDPRWIKAMAIISESLEVVASKASLRIQVRDDKGNYVTKNLDFSVM